MREILFRGKYLSYMTYGKEFYTWCEGDFYKDEKKDERDGSERIYIILRSESISKYRVLPETVGEYTGLKDRNDRRIFEGDIVSDGGLITSGLIAFHQEYASFFCDFYNMHYDMSLSNNWLIIGNIHDNPELLGKKG